MTKRELRQILFLKPLGPGNTPPRRVDWNLHRAGNRIILRDWLKGKP